MNTNILFFFFLLTFNNTQDRKLSTHPVPIIVGFTPTIIYNLAGGEVLVKHASIFYIMRVQGVLSLPAFTDSMTDMLETRTLGNWVSEHLQDTF